ncbi:family protein : UPF0271 protein CF68_05470 OS=Cupriavidus sp. SK-4 GN=CF68_05470 PE=3 SV=1: LamB_YcsF [Tuwongella immobilis]|uniref:LamB/YcsF family protein n=2 Tax=Tuwongella immobilis TaxID=692036 RepID=A0A6C2YIE9_9BACT|nr:family protein : UPF0271 protein CF68_05470 OS=Cupriavidus sp. SK-4 GN=CF68_05470 PE=3 SV=1: LamB_YcsF [Tuwongella immobilis]VTR97503.1 family protein : UPF0271 protein CF68_05470 OS=Cupriavidus sp. SK-4 GN=CF68_05470 PE=3 SV=1: LamB_YcsF [Tuwongella immobilis]
MIDLNSDLGEGSPADADILALVTSANIAAGLHAGTPIGIAQTVRVAIDRGIALGLHPGYADREHFGRVELARSPDELANELAYQFGALDALVRRLGGQLRYLKPHGALYHQASRDADFARPIIDLAEQHGLALLGLPNSQLAAGSQGRCPFIAEGFADRRYRPDGTLVPRSEPGAFVHDALEAVQQVEWLIREHAVRSICVHGDNPQALEFVRTLRQSLLAIGHEIRAFV